MKLLNSKDHESNAKAILALFVFLLAVGVLWLFNTYQESILASGSFNLFLGLAVIGSAFLLILLYMVNNQKIVKTKSSHSKSRRR